MTATEQKKRSKRQALIKKYMPKRTRMDRTRPLLETKPSFCPVCLCEIRRGECFCEPGDKKHL